MKKITNTTSKEYHPEWCFGVNPKAIMAQEARGQEELVSSNQLPVRVIPEEDRELLIEAGVKFGEPLPKDPIFCDVILPEGWKIIATKHSMWSDLVDNENQVRANIFYKAAFYDRSAHILVMREKESKGGVL